MAGQGFQINLPDAKAYSFLLNPGAACPQPNPIPDCKGALYLRRSSSAESLCQVKRVCTEMLQSSEFLGFHSVREIVDSPGFVNHCIEIKLFDIRTKNIYIFKSLFRNNSKGELLKIQHCILPLY